MAVVETKPLLEEAKQPVLATVLPIFERGNYATASITVETSNSSKPPKQVYIVTPVEPGTYPVLLFFPGTALSNKSYSQLFQFISSHGFILASPQLYPCMPPSGNTEIDSAAAVTNWLSSGLELNLPENVKPNLSSLILSGHSRGGQAAFALALGYAKNPVVNRPDQFSAIVTIDPVAGTNKCTELDPPILSYYDSFNFSIPVTVIGTGLGGATQCMAACAPEGANYEEFFGRCKSSRACFVAKDYGHMDALDDSPPDLRSKLMSKCVCKNGKDPRDPMRRCCGGIAVAFLKDIVLNGDSGDFMKIVEEPSIAPIQLVSVEFIEA